jgi:hypothetical protein
VTFHTYILAEKLSIEKLKKASMDIILDFYFDDFPSAETVAYLFGELPAFDPMLRLVADAFCLNNGVESIDKEEIGDLPKEFLIRIILQQYQLSHLPEKDNKH